MSGAVYKATCRIYVRNPHDYDEVALADAGTLIQERDDLILNIVVGGPYGGWISTACPESYGMRKLNPLEALGAQAE